MIAHRLSTIADADKIIVLENGEVLEEGSHRELLGGGGGGGKVRGKYAEMWMTQLEHHAVVGAGGGGGVDDDSSSKKP